MFGTTSQCLLYACLSTRRYLWLYFAALLTSVSQKGRDELTVPSRVSVSISTWTIWSNTEKKLLEHLPLPVPGQHSHDIMHSNSCGSLNLDSTRRWHNSTLVFRGLFSSASLLACFCYLLSPCCSRMSWCPMKITDIVRAGKSNSDWNTSFLVSIESSLNYHQCPPSLTPYSEINNYISDVSLF